MYTRTQYHKVTRGVDEKPVGNASAQPHKYAHTYAHIDKQLENIIDPTDWLGGGIKWTILKQFHYKTYT